MAIRTTEAIVLKALPFRTSSLIITVFTKDYGKVQGIAKGIKMRCSRKDTQYNCYLEPLTLNKIVYYEKSRPALYKITQCDLLNQFQNIRQDLEKLAAASFMIEFVDKGTMLYERHQENIFKLLLDSFAMLGAEKNIDLVLLFFKLRFLSLSGLMPQIKACVRCGKINLNQELLFSSLHGGLFCKNCGGNDKTTVPISRGAVASMIHVTQDNWEDVKRFKFAAQVEEELKVLLRDFINIHFDSDFKTLEFMEKIKIRKSLAA